MYEDISLWSPRILCLTSLPPTNGNAIKWDLVQNGLNIIDLRLLRSGSKCLVAFPTEEEKLRAVNVIKKIFRNKGFKIGIFDIRITEVRSQPADLVSLRFELLRSVTSIDCLLLDHNSFSAQELIYPEISIPYLHQISNKETKLLRSLYNMRDKIRTQYRHLQLPIPTWLSDPRQLAIELEPFEKCSRQKDYQFSIKSNLIRSSNSLFFGLRDPLTKQAFSLTQLYKSNIPLQRVTEALLPIASSLPDQPSISCRCFFPEPNVVYWILYSPMNGQQILKSGICSFDAQLNMSNRITSFDSIPFSLQGTQYSLSLGERYPVNLEMVERVQRTANAWLESCNQPVVSIDGNYHHFYADREIKSADLDSFCAENTMTAVMDVPASGIQNSFFSRIRDKTYISSFLYVGHNMKAFMKHAQFLCYPFREQKSEPFIPIRCKGFDRAPGTNWFTFATLFRRKPLYNVLHTVKNVTHFIHSFVC